jgi:hypothetical protein
MRATHRITDSCIKGNIVKKSISAAALAACTVLIAGCMHVTPPTGNTPVPPDRILDHIVTQPAPGKLEVDVGRPSGGRPFNDFNPEVYVDGHIIAQIGPGEVLRMYLLPGQYELGVRQSWYNQQRYATDLTVGNGATSLYMLRWADTGFVLDPIGPELLQ